MIIIDDRNKTGSGLKDCRATSESKRTNNNRKA
jgi:hypothetical protein